MKHCLAILKEGKLFIQLAPQKRPTCVPSNSTQDPSLDELGEQEQDEWAKILKTYPVKDEDTEKLLAAIYNSLGYKTLVPPEAIKDIHTGGLKFNFNLIEIIKVPFERKPGIIYTADVKPAKEYAALKQHQSPIIWSDPTTKNFGLDYTHIKGIYKDFTFEIRYDHAGTAVEPFACGLSLCIYFKDKLIDSALGNLKGLIQYSENWINDFIIKYSNR